MKFMKLLTLVRRLTHEPIFSHKLSIWHQIFLFSLVSNIDELMYYSIFTTRCTILSRGRCYAAVFLNFRAIFWMRLTEIHSFFQLNKTLFLGVEQSRTFIKSIESKMRSMYRIDCQIGRSSGWVETNRSSSPRNSIKSKVDFGHFTQRAKVLRSLQTTFNNNHQNLLTATSNYRQQTTESTTTSFNVKFR